MAGAPQAEVWVAAPAWAQRPGCPGHRHLQSCLGPLFLGDSLAPDAVPQLALGTRLGGGEAQEQGEACWPEEWCPHHGQAEAQSPQMPVTSHCAEAPAPLAEGPPPPAALGYPGTEAPWKGKGVQSRLV